MEEGAPSGRDTSFTQSPSTSTSTPSTSASSRGSSNLPPWNSRDTIDTSCCRNATSRSRGPVAPKGRLPSCEAVKTVSQPEQGASDDQRVSHWGHQAAERQQG